jgi:hypothetical protein
MDLEEWLETFPARSDGPEHHEWPTFTDHTGPHGYPLSEVFAFLAEREDWQPGPVPPPSPYYLPGALVAEFEEWRAG